MEEQEKITVGQVSIKWGLILAISLIVLSLVIQLSGLMGNQAVSLINYLLIIIMVYLAQSSFKKEGDSYMSYGQGLGIGTLSIAIGTTVSSIFMYVYMKFIDETMLEKIKDLQYDKMIEQGMSEDQIDQAMEMSAAFMTPEIITIMAILVTMFIGFILTLIITAITKNTNPAESV